MSGKRIKQSGDTLPLLKRLFKENFPNYWRGYLVAFIFMGLSSAATAATAWVMRDIINVLFVEGKGAQIVFFGVFVAVVSIVKGLAIYGQTVVLSKIGNSIVASMKSQMYAKLLTMRNEYFVQKHSSKFIASMNHNANSARSALNLLATSLGRDLMTVTALLGVMIVLDPMLSLASAIIAPPIILGVTRIVRRIRALASEEAGLAAGVVRNALESARGIEVVKTFGLQEILQQKMDRDLQKFEKRVNKLARLQARTGPLMETLGGLAVGGVIMYAAWQTTQGKSPGEFMAFLTAFLLAYEPAKRLARLQVTLERNLVGLRLMYAFIDNPEVEEDRAGAKSLLVSDGALEVENVVFGYHQNEPVVRGVSLEVCRGEVVALVGPSGAGKTTVFALVQRFVSPLSGQILIDGQDIAEVTATSLRSKISVVSQNAFLFSGTIRENILMGRPDATMEEVRAAAEAAHALEFIDQMPDGFDEEVGENGNKLSGGQRQRIAIARALLKDAPILLLDEATSALDNISERRVQAAIEQLMEGRATIVIAHRLSTVARADRIYVLEFGQIVETGTHIELLKTRGAYYKMHNTFDAGDEEQGAA